MIATALVFLLGLFVAILVALLLTPILWRKAQGFARREFEATVPLTANEIRAEFDVVRATAAMNVRQGEIAADAMRGRMIEAQAALGRAEMETAAHKQRIGEMEARMAAFAAERDNFREIFAAHRDKERLLSENLDEAKRDGSLNAEELEALAVRFREMSDLAEERKVELVAAETRIERLNDALRSVERASSEKDTLIRLLRRETERPDAGDARPAAGLRSGVMPGMMPRAVSRPAPTGETAAMPGAAPRLRDVLSAQRHAEELSDKDGAELRERIAAVAASVIHQAALAEGEGSPLAPLLHPAKPGTQKAASGYLTLAERVRRLAGAESADVTSVQAAPSRAE